jgi:hypothetical protein
MAAFSALRSVAFGLATAMITGSAEAQICTGAAPFSSGLVRIGAGAGGVGAGYGGADGNPSSVGFRVSLGAKQGPFASVRTSSVLYLDSPNPFIREGFAKDSVYEGSNVGFSGGYGISLSASRRIELCPVAGLTNQSGPYFDCSVLPRRIDCTGGSRGSGRAFWFGGSIGALSKPSPSFAFAPFAAAVLANSKISASARSFTDDYMEITVGLGLMYRRLTIRPTLSVPFGLEEGSPSVALEFAFNLGPKT